jgi:hypothetical protein
MALRIVIYGKEGDGAAFAALGSVRSMVSQLRIEANIQLITDPAQVLTAGIDALPAVSVENLVIAQGYVPSRNELARALGAKVDQMEKSRRGEH